MPDNDLLVGHIEHWARLTPDAEALVNDGKRTSYAALAAKVESHARAMIAAGVAPGDRVACLAPPSPEFVVSLLAATAIGAIWIGLNPRYRLDELRYVLADSSPRLLFARQEIDGRDYRADLAELGRPGMVVVTPDLLGAFLAAGAAVDDATLRGRRPDGRAPSMIVYTSGSTGKPKGAMLCQSAIAAFALAQNRLWPVAPQRALNYFPINHIGCVVDLGFPALVAGGTIVFMEKSEPAGSLELMERERCTVWGSVPSVFQMQLDLPGFARFDLSAVQLILWEGAPMAEPLVRRLHAIHPRLATNYGMTEATSAILAEPPCDDPAILATSVGYPFEGVEIRLVGVDGADVTEGEPGETWTRSALVMLGYWNRPIETAQAIDAEGWLRTGDIGRRRSDGRYAIVGRIKEMYKSGGYNVYPLEVEAVIEGFAGVHAVAVVGAPDPLWDEVGVAFVAADPGVTAEALLGHCRAYLANYKVPKRIELRASLPLLPIGKTDKVALAAEARLLIL